MNSVHLATENFDFAGNRELMRAWRSRHRGHKGNRMGALRLADPLDPPPALRPSELAQLREVVSGELVLPGDPAYDQARKVWNGMVDKRPDAVLYCAGSSDVVAAV